MKSDTFNNGKQLSRTRQDSNLAKEITETKMSILNYANKTREVACPQRQT